jgi:23S rRNA (guanine745-N1)-methyltransferase
MITPATNFACPIDGTALFTSLRHPWRCANGHSFDVAREGYCNLLVVQHKASRDPGDTVEMVAARRRVLDTGIYAPIADSVFAHLRHLAGPPTNLDDRLERPSPGSLPPSPWRGDGRGGGDGSVVPVAQSHPHLTRASSIFAKNENRARVVLPPQGGGGENLKNEPASSGPLRVVDAGCGEGYYLARIAELAAADGLALELAGTDVSKWAVRAAAKRRAPVAWAVANNRHLPLQAASVDAILCLFGFPVWQGFTPVLAPDGRVLMVDPGPEHLAEMRAVIYPTVNRSPVVSLDQAEAAGYVLETTTPVTYAAHLTSQSQIADLFAMTPHAHRASETGRAALQALDRLTVTVDVVVRQLRLAGAQSAS